MTKALKKCFALTMTFMLVFLMFALPTSAAYQTTAYSLNNVTNKNLSYYTAKDIYIGQNKLSEQALLINGTVYVPLRAFSNAVASGARVTYDSKSRTMTVVADGLTLTATDGAYTVYANDRPLFAKTPITILSNGRMYLPISTAVKAFGMKYTEGSYSVSVWGSYTPLKPASEFYREDEVYWLSRIISAESRGEPIIGQIAVGNVILNRVRSSAFPNTIYSVIFDRKNGVQFTPTLNGEIYKAPSYTATLAAKICLEGFTVAPDVLFFVEPRVAPNSWVRKNRPYIFTIGNHDFFR